MKVRSFRCCKNDGGVSDMTCSTFILVCCPKNKLVNRATSACDGRYYLEIFHESFQECHKMFGSPNVTRHSFL
jgi:hypothetical protein